MSMLRDGQAVLVFGKPVRHCRVLKLIGAGGQGEVYAINFEGLYGALKWYYPHYIQSDPAIFERILRAIGDGPPSDRFLWPLALALTPDRSSFGYIMPLREPRFHGIDGLIKGEYNMSGSSLTTAAFEHAYHYRQLHARGRCYRDISFGNAFVDPGSGEVRICDNDNVDIDNAEGVILGTPLFIAPEVYRQQAQPSSKSDLYALAVLIFCMLIGEHPLHGKQMTELVKRGYSGEKMLDRLHKDYPLYIFDLDDPSNRPSEPTIVSRFNTYPRFVRRLFNRAFSKRAGLFDQDQRVQEGEWHQGMIQLRDALFACHRCGAENFYDEERLKEKGALYPCWHCGGALQLPPRIRIRTHMVMLNHDTRLFPHHVDPMRAYDFSTPVADVSVHPSDRRRYGLRNLTDTNWYSTSDDGTVRTIAAGKSITLAPNTRINFGKLEGTIRV